MRPNHTVRNLRPLEPVQPENPSPRSSTSSYPASPTDERQSPVTTGLATGNLVVSPAPAVKHPPAIGEVGRAESNSEFFTPLPGVSPLSLNLLQGTANAARDARTDQSFQGLLTTEPDPFDRAVPARDLAAELQGRERAGSSGTHTDTSRRDEGSILEPDPKTARAEMTGRLSPVPMQASLSRSSKRSLESDSRPSPSPSEDARKLADVYGMYDLDDDPASEPEERLTSEAMGARGTTGSRHAREPAQVGAADIFKHEVLDVDERPPLARSQVLDELDLMLGQAMEDAQQLNIGGSEEVRPLSISPAGGNRLSIATSGAYEDATDEGSFEKGAPEVLDTPMTAGPTQGLALFTGAPVSETAAAADQTPVLPHKTSTGSDKSGSPVSVYPPTVAEPPTMLRRAQTASTISSPPSPATPRHRLAMAARPATARSSSLQHTEWQARQQRQALAAEKLRRVRPLPASMDYSDVKRLRTSADRAKAYAIKINALVKEDTGIDLWLDRMREQRAAQAQLTPTPSRTSSSLPRLFELIIVATERSPATLFPGGHTIRGAAGAHHPRDVSTAVSVMSFPTRPDASRAVEINHDSPAPPNLMHPSSLPFPGVYRPPLASIPSGGSPTGTGPPISPSTSQSTVASGKPASFLTTLGRKASRRPGQGTRHSPVIDTSVARGSGSSGPRGPRPSFVAATTVPRPNSAIYGAATTSPSSASRSSFAYGQSPTKGRGKAFEESLDKLEDILPQVNRETLGHFLQQEGGDDLAAIVRPILSLFPARSAHPDDAECIPRGREAWPPVKCMDDVLRGMVAAD